MSVVEVGNPLFRRLTSGVLPNEPPIRTGFVLESYRVLEHKPKPGSRGWRD